MSHVPVRPTAAYSDTPQHIRFQVEESEMGLDEVNMAALEDGRFISRDGSARRPSIAVSLIQNIASTGTQQANR
jgi:hypothetical protein